MNNQELELRIKTILSTKNFFDMMVLVKTFKKEYKKSDFYKATKMPLTEVIKQSKIWYSFQLDHLLEQAQKFVDDLNIDNINDIINQVGKVFEKENESIMSFAKEFENLVKGFRTYRILFYKVF